MCTHVIHIFIDNACDENEVCCSGEVQYGVRVRTRIEHYMVNVINFLIL